MILGDKCLRFLQPSFGTYTTSAVFHARAKVLEISLSNKTTLFLRLKRNLSRCLPPDPCAMFNSLSA